jgi:catechol 2,3-dioxygenase-like lactoylglutathione lyase family enzyme
LGCGARGPRATGVLAGWAQLEYASAVAQSRATHSRRGSVLPVLAGAPFIGFIPVRDTSGARGFYEGILGLRVVEETSFALVIDANGTMLRLTGVRELRPQPFTIAGWQVPDVTAAARLLSESGVRFIRYDGMDQDELGIWTTPGGDRVAWFQDPDGNTLSLTTFASR